MLKLSVLHCFLIFFCQRHQRDCLGAAWNRGTARGEDVKKGPVPGPGHWAQAALVSQRTYRPLPDHLLRESGSSGATGGERRDLGEEGTWCPPRPTLPSDISPNPTPHLPDAGFDPGFQQRKLSFPELVLPPSPPLSLHPLHSLPLPDLPAKNLSGTGLHLTKIHWRQR